MAQATPFNIYLGTRYPEALATPVDFAIALAWSPDIKLNAINKTRLITTEYCPVGLYFKAMSVGCSLAERDREKRPGNSYIIHVDSQYYLDELDKVPEYEKTGWMNGDMPVRYKALLLQLKEDLKDDTKFQVLETPKPTGANKAVANANYTFLNKVTKKFPFSRQTTLTIPIVDVEKPLVTWNLGNNQKMEILKVSPYDATRSVTKYSIDTPAALDFYMVRTIKVEDRKRPKDPELNKQKSAKREEWEKYKKVAKTEFKAKRQRSD